MFFAPRHAKTQVKCSSRAAVFSSAALSAAKSSIATTRTKCACRAKTSLKRRLVVKRVQCFAKIAKSKPLTVSQECQDAVRAGETSNAGGIVVSTFAPLMILLLIVCLLE